MEPFVNAEPYMDEFDITDDDEFVILGNFLLKSFLSNKHTQTNNKQT